VLDSFADEPRPVGNVVLRLMVGRVVFAAGRFNDARDLFANALARWTPTMQPYTRRWARSMLQWCNVCTGRPVDDDLDDISAGSRVGVGFGGTDIQGGVLAARIAQGQRAAAQQMLRRDIIIAEESGDIGSLLDLLTFSCVEFTADSSAVALAQHVRRLAAGPEAAAGPMPSYAAQLALAEATLSNTAADWSAAAGLYRNIEHHFIAARLQARAATVAGTEGDRRLATSFTNQARRDAAQCQDAVVPELAGLAADGPGVVALTPREVDIVRMVAAGKSSKEVAAALFLSVRTVDNHLQRVYAKLGVSSRQDLAAALDGR
jgi:DNA-binding CsgD family transcriptional regulator